MMPPMMPGMMMPPRMPAAAVQPTGPVTLLTTFTISALLHTSYKCTAVCEMLREPFALPSNIVGCELIVIPLKKVK